MVTTDAMKVSIVYHEFIFMDIFMKMQAFKLSDVHNKTGSYAYCFKL